MNELEIKTGYDKLIKALDPEKYPRARTYIENFPECTFSF